MSWPRRAGHEALRLWWRLRRPVTRGARVVLSDERGRVCLVHHSYGQGWYLPGGALRRGEHPEAGARREVLEELGVEVKLCGLLGVYNSTAEAKRDTIWVFSATTGGELAQASPEIAAWAWFAPDDLPPDTSPATRRRAEEWAGRRQPQARW